MAIAKKATPESLGWLRRPEMDRECHGEEVWEQPNGALYVHPKGKDLVIYVREEPDHEDR